MNWILHLYNRTVCFSDIFSHPVLPRTFSFGFFLSARYQSLASAEETSYRSVWLSGPDHCKQETHWLEYEQTAERGKYTHTQKRSQLLGLWDICLFLLQYNSSDWISLYDHMQETLMLYMNKAECPFSQGRVKRKAHTHTHRPISKQSNSKSSQLCSHEHLVTLRSRCSCFEKQWSENSPPLHCEVT